MKTNSLSQEIENLNKKDFSIKEKKTSNKPILGSTTNLPAVRKVAIAKQRTQIVLLVALFVSCYVNQ